MTIGTPDRPPGRDPEYKRGRLVRTPKPATKSPGRVHITEIDDGSTVLRRTGGRSKFVGIVGPPPPRGQRRKR